MKEHGSNRSSNHYYNSPKAAHHEGAQVQMRPSFASLACSLLILCDGSTTSYPLKITASLRMLACGRDRMVRVAARAPQKRTRLTVSGRLANQSFASHVLGFAPPADAVNPTFGKVGAPHCRFTCRGDLLSISFYAELFAQLQEKLSYLFHISKFGKFKTTNILESKRHLFAVSLEGPKPPSILIVLHKHGNRGGWNLNKSCIHVDKLQTVSKCH